MYAVQRAWRCSKGIEYLSRQATSITKYFPIIFADALQSRNRRNPAIVKTSCALRSHDDMAIAAAKNFSEQSWIILAEREKGDDHVSKE